MMASAAMRAPAPIARRSALLAAAGILATSGMAKAATTTIALRPGQPRVEIRARTLRLAVGEAFTIAFTGPGAPEAEIRLPTWYGDGLILHSLPIAGREVLLASFQGNRGTGIAQKLVAVIGCDDAGALRILGIETLSFSDAQSGIGSRRLDGRLEAMRARDTLLLHHTTSARLHHRGRTTGSSERWTTRLAWNGSGILAAPPIPARAGEIRRRVDRARQRIGAILAAAPVTDATALPYDESGIWSVGHAMAVD